MYTSCWTTTLWWQCQQPSDYLLPFQLLCLHCTSISQWAFKTKIICSATLSSLPTIRQTNFTPTSLQLLFPHSCWTKMVWLRCQWKTCCNEGCSAFTSRTIHSIRYIASSLIEKVGHHMLHLCIGCSRWRPTCRYSINTPCRETWAPSLLLPYVGQSHRTWPSSPRRVLCQGWMRPKCIHIWWMSALPRNHWGCVCDFALVVHCKTVVAKNFQ